MKDKICPKCKAELEEIEHEISSSWDEGGQIAIYVMEVNLICKNWECDYQKRVGEYGTL